MTASFPASIKSFTSKTDGVDDVMAVDVNELQEEIAAIETELGATPKGTSASVQAKIVGFSSAPSATANSVIVTGTNAVFAGDVYTTAYTDYSASSTIVGWSSFTTKVIYYKKIGKFVFVTYHLEGTSDNASTTFTLPYALPAGLTHVSPNLSRDNGTYMNGYALPTASSSTVNCYPSTFGGTWTASGTKTVRGQFFYEVA